MINIREIKEFNNYYITNSGKVISKRGMREISSFVDNTGYLQIVLYRDGKRHYKRIHNLVYTAYVSEQNGLFINHKDGNKLNNHIDNLELATNQENVSHSYDKGLYRTRKRIKIRVTSKDGSYSKVFNSIRELSEELGLNRKTVSEITKGNKRNNYPYDFEIVDYCKAYFINLFDKEMNYLGKFRSAYQLADAYGLDRHSTIRAVEGNGKHRYPYIFQKVFVEESSQETIENTSIGGSE